MLLHSPLLPGRPLQESAAMYLDTVNYEHLAVSQQQFLEHLAAAGIPEAHLELHRMQQEEAAAAAAADPAVDYGGSSGAATPEGDPAAAAAAAAAAGEAGGSAAAAASVARAAAEGAAAAQLRQEQAAAAAASAAVADVGDVLEGLQLADDSSSSLALAGEGEAAGLASVQTSQPATPLGVGASREGSLPSLSPLGTSQSPMLLDPAAAGAAAAAAPTIGGSSGDGDGSGAMPRGLSFDAASDLATAAEQQEQQAEQQRQHQAEQEGQAEAAAAAVGAAAGAQAAAERYAEAALIEEMVAEGTRHVLAAEAAGMLQQRYPFMYAQAEDLSLVSEPQPAVAVAGSRLIVCCAGAVWVAGPLAPVMSACSKTCCQLS